MNDDAFKNNTAKARIQNDGTLLEGNNTDGTSKLSDVVYVTNTDNGSATASTKINLDAESTGRQYISSGTLSGELKGDWYVTGETVTANAVVVNQYITLTVQDGGYLAGTVEIKAGGVLDVQKGGSLEAATTLKGTAGYKKADGTVVACVPAVVKMAGKNRATITGDLDATVDKSSTYTGNSSIITGWYNKVLIDPAVTQRGYTIGSNVSAVLYLPRIEETFAKDAGTTALAMANVLSCDAFDVYLDNEATSAITIGSRDIKMIHVNGSLKTSGLRNPASSGSADGKTGAAEASILTADDALLYVKNDMTLQCNTQITNGIKYNVGGTLKYNAPVGDNPSEIVCGKFVTEAYGSGKDYKYINNALTTFEVGTIDAAGDVDLASGSSGAANSTVKVTGSTIDVAGTLTLPTNCSSLKFTDNLTLKKGTTVAFSQTSTDNNIALPAGKTLTISAGATLTGNSIKKVTISQAASDSGSNLVIEGNLLYATSLISGSGAASALPAWIHFGTYGYAAEDGAPNASSSTTAINQAWKNSDVGHEVEATIDDNGYLYN